jgi:uncharacterized protein (TIGR02284 family)
MARNPIAILSELVETAHDRERNYRRALNDARNETLKRFFLEGAEHGSRDASALQDMLVGLGGTPQAGGSVGAALHRNWAHVKAAVAGRNDDSVLVECEKEEDIAKKRFFGALRETLPADVRSTVERMFEDVQRDHANLRTLRDEYAAAHPRR